MHHLVPLPLRRLAATSLLALAACAAEPGAEDPSHSPAATRTVTVFAAASLTEAFTALAADFERRHPDVNVALHTAGTPTLVTQLLEGAPAHVFASADTKSMQRVVDAGLAVEKPRTFASNHLAIITAPGNPRGITGLADLARQDLTVAYCGPDVPAGRYAREALEKAGIAVRSVSDEPNVKALVTKVRLGELDAGIVYTSDAHAARDAVASVPLHEGHAVAAEYPIVPITSKGTAAHDGPAFLAFVLSPAGQARLAEHGFGPALGEAR